MITILIVDDSVIPREMLRDLLKGYNLNVIEAEDGVQAQEKLQSEKVDLVITDLIMPKMNGYELCRWIKNNSTTSHIPVLMCSTKSEEFDRYWGMKQGADAYITKPYRPNDMLTAIKTLLKSHH